MQYIRTAAQFDIRRPDLARPQRSYTLGKHHVSELIGRAYRDLGLLNPEDEHETIEGHVAALAEYEQIGENGGHGQSALLTKISLGLALEDWFMPQQAGVEYHPGEIEYDDVIGSPDGLKWMPMLECWCVHECKLTWDYAGSDVCGKDLYLSQVKAYCKMLTTRFAKLHVVYVNGYMAAGGRRAKAGMPAAFTYALEFTQSELDANWKMLKVTQDRILKEERETANV